MLKFDDEEEEEDEDEDEEDAEAQTFNPNHDDIFKKHSFLTRTVCCSTDSLTSATKENVGNNPFLSTKYRRNGYCSPSSICGIVLYRFGCEAGNTKLKLMCLEKRTK